MQEYVSIFYCKFPVLRVSSTVYFKTICVAFIKKRIIDCFGEKCAGWEEE